MSSFCTSVAVLKSRTRITPTMHLGNECNGELSDADSLRNMFVTLSYISFSITKYIKLINISYISFSV